MTGSGRCKARTGLDCGEAKVNWGDFRAGVGLLLRPGAAQSGAMCPPRLVYLGPEGSFTHQAALALAPRGCVLAPLDSLTAVLSAVLQGQAEYAVAALDSAAGPIADTRSVLDSGRAEELGRHALEVSFDLYRLSCDETALIGVFGHEKALAQCADWIRARAVEAQALASNTAGLARVRDGRKPGWGAIGPPGLAEAYGLAVCGQALEGPARNETLFVLLRRAGGEAEREDRP